MIKIIDRIRMYFEWMGSKIIKLFSVVLIILTIVAVFNRYFLGRPMSWNEEISLYLFMGISFWGIINASRDNEHFRVDLILEGLKGRKKECLELIILVVCLIISLLGVYFGIKIVSITTYRTVVLKIPQKIIILSTMVMGFIGMSVEYLYKLIKKIEDIKTV